MWPVEAGRDRWAVIASTAPASSSNSRDYTSQRIDKTNSVILGVHD
jgi:hypothetical protein